MNAYSNLAPTIQAEYGGYVDAPRRTAAINLPIFDDTPPDEVLQLCEDDIVGNAAENAEFRDRVDAYLPPFDFSPDSNMRFLEACHLVTEAYKVIGVQGILKLVEYIEKFDALICPETPSCRPEPPEAVLAMAEVRSARAALLKANGGGDA